MTIRSAAKLTIGVSALAVSLYSVTAVAQSGEQPTLESVCKGASKNFMSGVYAPLTSGETSLEEVNSAVNRSMDANSPGAKLLKEYAKKVDNGEFETSEEAAVAVYEGCITASKESVK